MRMIQITNAHSTFSTRLGTSSILGVPYQFEMNIPLGSRHQLHSSITIISTAFYMKITTEWQRLDRTE
jgi:hypothetical protein